MKDKSKYTRLKEITSKILNRRTVSIITVLLVVFSISNIPSKVSVVNTKSVALDNSEPQVKNVNLNIFGINDPQIVTSQYYSWSNCDGHYVYYGNYFQQDVINKEPIRWRVLSTNSDSTGNAVGSPNSMLLMSDKILDSVLFNESYERVGETVYKKENGNVTSYLANDYTHSNLKYWLNSTKDDDDKYIFEDINNYNYAAKGFYDTAFSKDEQNVINATTQKESILDEVKEHELINDKVFLLSSAELNNPLYGFLPDTEGVDNNFSRKLEYTQYVEGKGNNATYPTWQLRSTNVNCSDRVNYIYNGKILDNGISKTYSGVAPAINLNKSDIAFVTGTGFDKTVGFTTTYSGYNKEWVLAVYNSIGFEATLSSDSISMVKQGGKVSISVNKLPDNASEYNQISAILVDEVGTVAAYGRVSDNVELGTMNVTMPYDVNDGNYTLYVFAQDVNSTTTKYLTDYVSNMSAIKLAVNTNNNSIQEQLEEEKKAEHNLTVTAYDTKDYAEGGNGVKFTNQGITIKDWDYEDSKYLQIEATLHDGIKNDHAIRIKLPKELYFVGEIDKLPVGCDDMQFVANEDISVNGDAAKYSVEDKSGVLTYYVKENVRKITIQLEVRYDKNLWDKQKGSALTEDGINPIEVSINYEPNKNEHLEGGELQTVKVSKAYAGKAIDRFGYFIYSADGIDLSKENTKKLTVSVVENNQTTDTSYNKEVVFELQIPYWTDNSLKKHYLKYDVNRLVISEYFFKGAVNYEVIEQGESVLRIKVKNCLYNTGLLWELPLTYPSDINTNQEFISFSNGKFIISAISNTGRNYVPLNENIAAVQYATSYKESLSYLNWGGITTYYDTSRNGVIELGGLHLENKGNKPSTSKELTIQFPSQLLITTMNLPADTISQQYTIKYKLKDENGNNVYLDSNGNKVTRNSRGASEQWTTTIDNGKNYNKEYTNNIYCTLDRSMLPMAQGKYFISELSYTLGEIKAGAQLFNISRLWNLDAAGNYFGYISKNARTGYCYTNTTIKSPNNSGIQQKSVSSATTISNSYTSAYAIDSVKFSKNDIEAGDSVDMSGSMFVINYPYGTSMNLGKLKLAFALNNNVTIDTSSIKLSLPKTGASVEVKDVTSKSIGNNETLWIVSVDPNIYLGYASETLGEITNGNRLDFNVKLLTDKRMNAAALFTNDIVFCSAGGVDNVANGSYSWAKDTDKWDLNGNGKTTDGMGKSDYIYGETCNVIPCPPSLDITDSLSISGGKGSMDGGIVCIGDDKDIVTYSLNIESLDYGKSSQFSYFVPIPKLTTSRDSNFMMSSKDSSFDMKLLEPVSISGKNIYKIEYCFKTNISYNEAKNLSEDSWYTVNGSKFYDFNNNVVNDLDFSNVTMVRLTVNGDIEKGMNTTIELKLAYNGTNINKDTGKENVWRSSGYYAFDNGTRTITSDYMSPGVRAKAMYTYSYDESLKYVARSNTKPTQTNVVSNTFPGEWDKSELKQMSHLHGKQGLKVANIELNNIELKSVQFMKDNQNTLTPEEANKYFAFELVPEKGNSIDLSDSEGEVVADINGMKKPNFRLNMYYGSKFTDVITNRSMELTLVSEKGITFNILAEIYFVARNGINVSNGEDSYMRGPNTLTKVFYTYEMQNDICAKEDIKFTIEKTNDMVDVAFSLSTSPSPTILNYWRYIVPKEYVTIRDENGATVSPNLLGIYILQGNMEYTLSIDEEYLRTLGDEMQINNPFKNNRLTIQANDKNNGNKGNGNNGNKGNGNNGNKGNGNSENIWDDILSRLPWYDFVNKGGSDSQFLYMHAVVPNQTSTQEILIIKRRLFELN